MSLTKEDIIRLRDNGEQTTVQFKERVTRDNHTRTAIHAGHRV